MVLIWGMWLCYKIRNAPAAYNESKFISWAIYNAMFVTSFLMVVRLEFPSHVPLRRVNYVFNKSSPKLNWREPKCLEAQDLSLITEVKTDGGIKKKEGRYHC